MYKKTRKTRSGYRKVTPASRRTVSRRRRYANPRRAILSGFPKSKLVKLRYVDSRVTLDASVDSFTSTVFRANSIFDPDYSGVGHQPMGHDQWAAIYERYTVLGSKITVTYTPSGTSNVNGSYMGVTLSGSVAPLGNYTDIDNILESKLTSATRTVGNTLSNGFPRARDLSVSKTFSAKKFFGVRDVQDGAALSAQVGANPSRDAYFGVWTAAVDGGDPGSISMRVQIDYIVLFKEPKNLDGS